MDGKMHYDKIYYETQTRNSYELYLVFLQLASN